MRPRRATVTRALVRRARAQRGVELHAAHVHLRRREIAQAAGVIGIEVREHDVAHVLALEAEPLQLRERGLALVEARAQEQLRRAEPPPRVAHVGYAEAGVDEHEIALA